MGRPWSRHRDDAGPSRGREVALDAARSSEHDQVQQARQEHHLDPISDNSMQESLERSRAPGVLLDEGGRQHELGILGEAGQALLGAVDFGGADEEMRT